MPSRSSHKFKHLTSEKRIKLELLIETRKSKREIANILQVHRSTIYRELKRCKNSYKYDHNIANEDYITKKKNSCKKRKASNKDLLQFIEDKLKEKWSPEIISNKWNEEHAASPISHMTIYNIIKLVRPDWIRYLIYRGKNGNKKKIYHSSVRSQISDRVDISLRPPEANTRSRIGDIEADTILSCRGHKSCLAVFVDRKTRFLKIVKLKDKSAIEMSTATIFALRNMKVKTITYDNGTENALHHYVNQELNCQSYFCRTYCSSDKGSIENRNKIIRQYYPKGTNFDLITQADLDKIERKINNRPLAILGYKTPAQLFQYLLQLDL